MSIKAEHKELIELVIKRNPHYKGNEEFFPVFYDEVFHRVRNTFEVLGDKLPPQSYLEKVVQKAILFVLKDKNRLTTKVFDDESPIENLLSFNINEKGEIVFNMPYPTSEREKFSTVHDQLRIIINNLYRMNENEPEKKYLRLFELKYNQNLSLDDLAFRMDLTEAQTAQRLFELLGKLSDYY